MVYVSYRAARCRYCGWDAYVIEGGRVWCGHCDRAWWPLWELIAVPC